MPFSSEDEILLRRSTVASLYLKGWFQAKIALETGVSQQQISQDLQAIRSDWKESSLVDFNEAKAKELAKIDHLESIYWKAWEDSTRPVKKSRKKYSGKVDKTKPQDRQQVSDFDTTDITEERQGNPRFLDGVMRCIEKRVAILGLDAPQKIQVDEKKLPAWIHAARPSSN
ncbi:hypothetical protein [Spirosoma fluminis]